MRQHAGHLIIAVGIIIATFILSNAYKYKFKAVETITVTGLAETDFTSDLVVWTAGFNRYGSELRSAYTALKQDEIEIRRYLNSKGIPDSSIIFSSVDSYKNFNRRYDRDGNLISEDFSGYTLSGKVRVESSNILQVEKLSREITELLEKGIELSSNPPEYHYTRLNELKIDLLAKASADARIRAETIAKNGGCKLGGIKKANMGVFQITGKNMNEVYSYGGAFNVSSKEKTASITLKVDYLVR